MQQKNLGLMHRLFGSFNNQRTSADESEPCCDGTRDAGPEPEPEREREPQLSGSAEPACAAESSVTAAAQGPQAAAATAVDACQDSIPVPNITDKPQQHSMPVPIRQDIIVGRSLCDVHSDTAISDAERDSFPAKLGQTPPLLSMIRQTVMEPREDGSR